MCCHLLPSPHPSDQPIHDDHHLLKPELHDFSHHRLHLTTGDWVADGVGEHLHDEQCHRPRDDSDYLPATRKRTLNRT